LVTAQEEFEALCFEFGIELDDVVSISLRRPYPLPFTHCAEGGVV
jgi:hypothetical protein